MATQISWLDAYNNNNTTFRAWGSAISTALSTFGWVQTSDTGQANWASATTTSTYGTYEVWKMGDSLQSTMPFFMRIDYFYNGGWFLRFTIGNSSDGAGVILGGRGGTIPAISSDAFVSIDHGMTVGSPSVGNSQCVFSGSTSSFRMGLFVDSDSPGYFAIERSQSNAGVETASYVTFIAKDLFGSEQISIGNLRRPSVSESEWIVPYYYSSFSNNRATTTTLKGGVLPILPFYDAFELPLRYTIMCRDGDIRGGQMATVNAYGSNATYFQVSSPSGAQYVNYLYNVSAGDFGILMLWS